MVNRYFSLTLSAASSSFKMRPACLGRINGAVGRGWHWSCADPHHKRHPRFLFQNAHHHAHEFHRQCAETSSSSTPSSCKNHAAKLDCWFRFHESYNPLCWLSSKWVFAVIGTYQQLGRWSVASHQLHNSIGGFFTIDTPIPCAVAAPEAWRISSRLPSP